MELPDRYVAGLFGAVESYFLSERHNWPRYHFYIRILVIYICLQCLSKIKKKCRWKG